MAYADIYANSAYAVTGSINSLQYSAENYNQFVFRLCYDNGVNWIQIDSYTVLGGDVWGQYSVSHTFSASPNTRYCVFVDVYHSSGTYTFQSGGVYTPQVYSTPGLPTNVNISTTTTTATVTFSQGTGAYYTNMDASWLGGTNDYITSGTTFNITGLTADTSYSFKLQSERSAAEGSIKSGWTDTYYFTTPKARPANWNWTTNISVGADYKSIDLNNKTIGIMPATEWCAFQDRINQFRVYKGYGNYPFTRAVAGYKCKQVQLNEVIDAINSMSPSISPPSTVKINVDCFTKLKNSLNSIY